jgi:putative flavoprotein involved in K+ transport
MTVDVAVIGGGQAGLAIGYHLKQAGVSFVILEAGDTIGPAWRERWDSLVLFTSRRYDSLPGLEFPGDPDGYPTRDEVVAYLEDYAARFDLPIELASPVRSVTEHDGVFELDVDGRRVTARQVVVATGPFQEPRVPPVAEALDPEVVQMHSTGYRSPAQIPAGTVLVVGGGNTGFQIAKELAGTHDVHLAVGSRQTPLPQRLLLRDLFWWLELLRVMRITVESRLGRKMKTRDTLIGSSPRDAAKHGVTMRPRAVAVSGRAVTFEDDSTLDVDAVVWATGYRLDHSFLQPAVESANGAVPHRRGVTDTPGLYFLGLPWQNTRGSALIGWVKDDAAFIADRIAERASAA